MAEAVMETRVIRGSRVRPALLFVTTTLLLVVVASAPKFPAGPIWIVFFVAADILFAWETGSPDRLTLSADGFELKKIRGRASLRWDRVEKIERRGAYLRVVRRDGPWKPSALPWLAHERFFLLADGWEVKQDVLLSLMQTYHRAAVKNPHPDDPKAEP